MAFRQLRELFHGNRLLQKWPFPAVDRFPVQSALAEDKGVVIIGARINPAGHDTEMEHVPLNPLATAVSLDGWTLADKSRCRHPLEGILLDAGAVKTVTLPGSTIQLSNQGGILTLLNAEGLKVHGVQYDKNDVSGQGRTVVIYKQTTPPLKIEKSRTIS